MSKTTQLCLYVTIVVIITALYFCAHRKINLPYHAVVPITITPTKQIVVHPTLNGHLLEMGLDLAHPDIFVQGLRPDTFAPAQTLGNDTQREAIVGLGMYKKICPLTVWQGNFATPMLNAGRLGFHAFDSLDPSEASRVTLDLHSKTMTIDWLPSRPRLIPSAHTIMLHLYAEGVDAQLNGHVPVRLAIATHASTTTLPWAVAMQLMSSGELTRLLRKRDKAPLAYHYPANVSATLAIGKRTWKLRCNTEVNGEVAELGMDILQYFRVIVDYRDRMLYLEPYTQ